MFKIKRNLTVNSHCYHHKKHDKTQIVIGSHYLNVNNMIKRIEALGKFNTKDIPMFSIDKSGEIYQHFDINFYSNFSKNSQSKKQITISLENKGYLTFNGEQFFDFLSNIYHNKPYKRKWKDFEYWDNYTEKQLSSLVELCNFLTSVTNITRNVKQSNVFQSNIDEFEGICYRSNFNKKIYDVYPSWYFKQFKNLIEK